MSEAPLSSLFGMNPSASASSSATPSSSAPRLEVSTTLVEGHGASLRATSSPETSGRSTSSRTTSGDRRRVSVDPGRPVGGLSDHLETGLLERAAGEPPERRVVVDDQDGRAHSGDPDTTRERTHPGNP